MALKARKPEIIKAKKPRVLLFGPPKIGKTTFLLNAPKLYFADAESGATQKKYREALIKAEALYLGAEDGAGTLQALTEEIRELAVTKHDRLTFAADSYSKLWEDKITEAQATVGSEFGRDKKLAIAQSRQFFYWLEKLDMTVFLICHAKDNWIRENNQLISAGKTFDGWDKLAFHLELILEAQKDEKFPSKRKVIVRGSRLEGFKEGEEFDFTWAEFAKRAGEEIITRAPEAFMPASKEQVDKIKKLIESVKLEEGWESKMLTKLGAEGWDEVSASHVDGAIGFLTEKFMADSGIKEAVIKGAK